MTPLQNSTLLRSPSGHPESFICVAVQATQILSLRGPSGHAVGIILPVLAEAGQVGRQDGRQ